MIQDFSKKMTVVLREDLMSWQLTNTVGHITAYLGNKMSETFDTGEYFLSKDQLPFPRNSQFAVVALKTTVEELKNLVARVRATDLLWIVYTQEMIDLIDDQELEKALSLVEFQELNILGIGLFGSKEKLKELTGHLKLWK